MTQTSPWSRGVIVSLLVLLFTATAVLMVRTWRIEQQLESQSRQIHGIAGLLEQTDQYSLSPEGLREVRSELESRLSDAVQRVEELESRSRAGQRVIEAAARSVVFLQGEYGFLDPGAGALLRIVLDQDGQPVQDAEGNPSVSPRGPGPVVGRIFMGTAFIATDDGLLLTNRHVALPWEFDESAKAISQLGLIPTMHRLIGYLPGIEESFDVELVLASETADIAVLRSEIPKGQVLPIELSTSPPQPGEEVFVLGYPTGIRALLARTNKAFVDSLLRDEQSDFWFLARRLSEGGYIAPLATRGIVGQVTPASIVYDAETTHGGSGGPVLGLTGEAQAINTAILVEFGGSNLGVPAGQANQLLKKAIAGSSDQRSPTRDFRQ